MPDELRLALSRSVLIDQRAGRGEGDDAMREDHVALDALLAGRERIAHRLQLVEVEALRHQKLVADEEDLAVGVERLRRGGNDRLPHFLVEAAHADHVGRILLSDGRGEVEEMPPVGEKERPAMSDVALRYFERSDGHRRGTARGADAHDRRVAAAEDDGPLRVPASAAAVDALADGHRRAAADLHPLQVSAGEESDRAAVR